MKSLKRLIQRQIMKFAPKSWRHQKARELLTLPTELPDELTIRIAETRQEVEAALHLVYQCYLATGYTKEQAHELRMTPYHLLQSTSVIIMCWKGRIVGTMSLIRDNPMGLPLEKEFDLSHLRKNGERLCEGGTFAIDPNFRGSHGALMHRLVRYTMIYMRNYFGVDQVVLVANPKMADLWEAIYLFEPLSKSNVKKNYDFANGHAAVGLSLDLRTHISRYQQMYETQPANKNWFHFLTTPQMKGEIYPKKHHFFINHSIMDSETIKYFGKSRTTTLSELSDMEKRAIAKSYGHETYESFLGQEPTVKRRLDVKLMASTATFNGGKLVEIRNISRDGLLVKMDQYYPQAKEFKLSLNLGKGEIAQVSAQVRWNSNSGLCGMKITQASKNWQDLWSQILENKETPAA